MRTLVPLLLFAAPLLADEDVADVERGRHLFAELRCAACHGALPGEFLPTPPGPDLAGVASRVTPSFLRAFLADPRASHRGTKMPDVLGDATPEERARVADEMAHFLASRTDAGAPVLAEPADAAVGSRLFHSVGCVACHAPRVEGLEGAGVPAVPDAVALDHVPAKYAPGPLSDFLFQPLDARPAGRMPDLALSRGEADAIAAYLLGGARVTPTPPEVDPARAEAGGAAFERLGCVACHALDGVPAPSPAAPVADLDPAGGCLSAAPGAVPRYDLPDADRADLAAALASPPPPDTDEARIARTLQAFDCTACHARGGVGGVSDDLDPYFTTDEPGLGDEARLPPPLDDVGAKLTTDWMHSVLYDGARVRDVMHARMPRFGEANLAHLTALLERADAGAFPPFTPPTPEGDQKREYRDGGRDLMGVTGYSCISCHDFKGKPSPNYRGLDLVDAPLRLRPEWFAAFLRDPQGLRPDVVMPQSWPGGVSSNDTILAGDADAQIGALWYFLTQGRSAADPRGLVNRPTRLEVTDEPRLYRGRSGLAGYRGIAVGFPAGVHYAFDANNGALAGIWTGDFVRVHWGGQQAGNWDPEGRATQLPRDVAIARLPDDDAPWPLRPQTTKEEPVNPDPTYPRNHGYGFEGYELDLRGVPSLKYAAGGARILDRLEPRADEALPPALVRDLLFVDDLDEPGALYLRLVTGAFEVTGEREVTTPLLRIQASGGRLVAREPDGREPELLLELPRPPEFSRLELTYEIRP